MNSEIIQKNQVRKEKYSTAVDTHGQWMLKPFRRTESRDKKKNHFSFPSLGKGKGPLFSSLASPGQGPTSWIWT